MKPKKLLQQIENGSVNNIAYNDFVKLIESLGFELVRSRGSHRIFRHLTIREILNLQETNDGNAKPYQIRELIQYKRRYSLKIGDDQ